MSQETCLFADCAFLRVKGKGQDDRFLAALVPYGVKALIFVLFFREGERHG